MNGIQAIIAQIITDTWTEADWISARARARAKECLSTYQEQVYIQNITPLERNGRKSALRKEHLSHTVILTTYNLRLSIEREMGERTFVVASKQLSELSDGRYVEPLAGLAVKVSSTGREEVVLSQRDRARYGKQVVTQAGGKLGDDHLTLSIQTRLTRDGLILNDGDTEVNRAFETLVRFLWGEMDRTVMEVLFG